MLTMFWCVESEYDAGGGSVRARVTCGFCEEKPRDTSRSRTSGLFFQELVRQRGIGADASVRGKGGAK
jgi:hypothetical protein